MPSQYTIKGSLPLSVLMGFVNADIKGIDAQERIPSNRVKWPMITFCIQKFRCSDSNCAFLATFQSRSPRPKNKTMARRVQFISIARSSAKYVYEILRLDRIGDVRQETFRVIL